MTSETWQVRFNNSILGVKVIQARKGRGPWLRDTELPAHVRDFLCLVPFNPTHPGSTLIVDRALFPNVRTLREKTTDVQWMRRSPPGIAAQGIVLVKAPPKPPKPRKIPRNVPAIRNMADLCERFGADEPRGLNRRLYKDTDCGASISVLPAEGEWIHNGSPRWDDLTIETPIHAFTIQTTVEDSDATVDSAPFVLPVTRSEVDAWIEYMEDEASRLFDEANL